MSLRAPQFGALLMAVLLGLDYGSKEWVRQTVELYEMTNLIPGLLDLTHVQNRGVSFSFMADWPDVIRLPLLVGVSGAAVLGMGFYLIRYWEELDLWTWLALLCILPGAVGNLIDRALWGHVTDFFHFRWGDLSFFVNNLADIFISFGVVFLVWGSLNAPKAQAPPPAS
jgi:signal peptidase II